jgi:hypothetical protein
MTAQMMDTVVYLDKPFFLVGREAGEMFDPRQHGLKTRMISTGCWLGYYCAYEVSEGQLYLCDVHVGLEAEDQEAVQRGAGPRLFGVSPAFDEQAYCHVFHLHEKYPFSGTLILGANLDYASYTPMLGLGPAIHNYQEVHDLVFEQGVLVRSEDTSELQAQVRAQMKAGGMPGILGMMNLPGVLTPPTDDKS